MKPLDAITASTQAAAQCIGLGDGLGTIDPGKWADILVVDDNPLQDIALLQQKERLLLVMKGGEAYVDRLR